MAEFKFEVVADYAEKDTLKVRSVSFNDREPKFDIRHWAMKKGTEQMLKGVTLTLEELIWLSETLPDVVKGITEGIDEEEETTDTDDETEKEKDFLEYVVSSAIDKKPDNEELHGVIVKNGKSYATNKEIIVKINDVFDICNVDDNQKLRTVVDNAEKAKAKSLTSKELTAFQKEYSKVKDSDEIYYYSFGKGKPTVNATYLGRAIETIGNTVKYADNGMITVLDKKGTAVILPFSTEIETVGMIEY